MISNEQYHILFCNFLVKSVAVNRVFQPGDPVSSLTSPAVSRPHRRYATAHAMALPSVGGAYIKGKGNTLHNVREGLCTKANMRECVHSRNKRDFCIVDHPPAPPPPPPPPQRKTL